MPLSPQFNQLKRFTAIQIVGTLLGLLGVTLTGQARADYLAFNAAAVAPNIAEIRVSQDGVYVNLEVFIGDIEEFSDLLPDSWFRSSGAARLPFDERLKRFAENGLSVRDQAGQVLPLSLNLIERRMRVDRASPLAGQRDLFSGQIIPAPPEDKRVVYAELFYAFGEKLPESLAFSPPKWENGTRAIEVGMIAFDRDVPLADFSFLSENTRLLIDWNDPWYSKFDSPNLTRRQKSGVSTFIYVEPREVRHESLIRVRELNEWMDLGMSPGVELSPEDQEQLVANALEFIASRNPVSIDGEVRSPKERRGEILTLDENGLQIAESPASVGADAAFVGVVLSFPQPLLPNEVAVKWDMFSEKYEKVPATLYDPAGPFFSGATIADPSIVWTNHLLTYQNPVVQPVETGNVGKFGVPLFLALGIAIALTGSVALMRRSGPMRTFMAVIVVAGLVSGVLARKAAIVYVPNPLTSTPDIALATQTVYALMENINFANLEITPSARQSELQPLVTKAALSDVAAELDRALAIRVPGGGLARVTSVNNLLLNDLGPHPDAFGFSALAEWSVQANAGHWGHDHRRSLEYRALIEVVDDAGFWKLDGITILEVRSPDV